MHVRHKRIVTKQEGAGPGTLPGPAPSRFKPLSQPPRSCTKHRFGASASARSRRGRAHAMTLRNGSTWAWSASQDYRPQARWVLLFEGITLGKMPQDGQKTEHCADKARVRAGSGFRCGETYPEPASAAKLCSDDQTHHPAIAHLSPFWPRTQQIARKSHALRPATRTRKRKQGDGGALTAMRHAPKMPTRTRLCPPCPLSGGKHPRRRDARERQATRNTLRPLRGCTGG